MSFYSQIISPCTFLVRKYTKTSEPPSTTFLPQKLPVSQDKTPGKSQCYWKKRALLRRIPGIFVEDIVHFSWGKNLPVSNPNNIAWPRMTYIRRWACTSTVTACICQRTTPPPTLHQKPAICTKLWLRRAGRRKLHKQLLYILWSNHRRWNHKFMYTVNLGFLLEYICWCTPAAHTECVISKRI